MTFKQRLLSLFVTYLSAGLLITLFVFLLFNTPLFGQAILFYRGILIISLASLFTLVLLYGLVQLQKQRNFFTLYIPKEEVLFSAVVAVAALHLCFFILVPVTIDRSVSTFLLSRMDDEQYSQGLTKSQLQDILVQEYVTDFDAVGRRIEEQLASKNINQHGEYFTLSTQGKKFLQFSALVAEMYDTNTRYVTTDKREK